MLELCRGLYVLKNGYHDSFDEVYKTWKYAIRGKTIDGSDLRIIIAFDEEGMIIITVIEVA